MRSRSCAFHSDSPEEFLQMAEAAINSPGIFYDDRLNRKMRNVLASDSRQEFIENTDPQQIHQLLSNKKTLILGLILLWKFKLTERMRTQSLNQINLGIITDNPEQVSAYLSFQMGLPQTVDHQSRRFNLLVACQDRTIFKYWILSREFLSEERCLANVYLNHCSEIFELKEGEESHGILDSSINWNIPELLI